MDDEMRDDHGVPAVAMRAETATCRHCGNTITRGTMFRQTCWSNRAVEFGAGYFRCPSRSRSVDRSLLHEPLAKDEIGAST